MADEELLTAEDFWRRLKIARSAFYKMVRKREIPPPFYIGRSPRWREADFQEVVNRLARDRGVEPPLKQKE
jgi:predicted DNA-binding transcriptional regulator AlpA